MPAAANDAGLIPRPSRPGWCGHQVGVVDHGVVPDAGQDCECRLGHPLAGDLVARRDRNDLVVLQLCDGDRAWATIGSVGIYDQFGLATRVDGSANACAVSYIVEVLTDDVTANAKAALSGPVERLTFALAH